MTRTVMTRTVLYFTDSDGFGGAEQALLSLLRGLDRTRWRPLLFHHGEPGLAPLLEAARQLDVELYTVPRLPLGKEGALLTHHFVRQLHAVRPVVFHAHLVWPLACKYGLVSAILARVPAIVATTHLFVELPYTLATRLQQRLLAYGIGRYIAVSHGVATRFQQTFQIPPHKFAVIHNAVAIPSCGRQRQQSLQPAGATATVQAADKPPIILTLARLDQQKGHQYLLQAAALVPEALFLLAGDGPERANLEAQAQALGVAARVHFLGYRTDTAALLAGCDLFVLPSLFEGLPLAVLEAMAAEKPVIATAIAGTGEAITHGETGLLVPPADPAALAQAIRHLLGEPLLAQRLAQAAKARAQQEFSVATMVQRVTQVYEGLLGVENR